MSLNLRLGVVATRVGKKKFLEKKIELKEFQLV
jgi:hypothetical protein